MKWQLGHNSNLQKQGHEILSMPYETLSQAKRLAVNVVLNAPAFKAPCKAPAAPASLCISVTLSFCP